MDEGTKEYEVNLANWSKKNENLTFLIELKKQKAKKLNTLAFLPQKPILKYSQVKLRDEQWKLIS